jgi:hypothetical protein
VAEVTQKGKLALVALAGAAVGAALARFRRPAPAPAGAPDDRAEELRRKLAEARAAVADEDDFEAAGMGAETLVEEAPRAEPPPAEEAPRAEPQPVEEVVERPVVQTPPPEPKPKPEPEAAEPPRPPKPSEPPPRDEFEAMRRRIHEEGKAAADEMRRSADPPEKP